MEELLIVSFWDPAAMTHSLRVRPVIERHLLSQG
jgi:hypothetical protein